MTRRSRWLLALLAALLALGAVLHWASRPQRVTSTVLDGVGAALGLELTASGIGEYRLRGEPRLVVRDLVARQPGAPHALFRAGRLDIALPWSTLRAGGDVLAATRLEVDDATLDLPALRRWQATRPPAAAPRIPTLTNGLQVRRSAVVDDGWRIDGLSLDTPHVEPRRPVDADLSGTLHIADMRAPFDLSLAMSRPTGDAQATLRGTLEATAPNWRLPATVHAQGQLRLGAEPARLDDLRFGAVARLIDDTRTVPFTAGLAGRLHVDKGLRLERAGLALRGEGVVPTLDAGGSFAWNRQLAVELDGMLAQWPAAWPALPAPLGRPRTAVPFALAYAGPLDLSGIAQLEARHEGASVDTAFSLPEILAWNDTRAAGSPLPPLSGRMSADRIEIAGATLEGVEVVIEEDPTDRPPAAATDADTVETSGDSNPGRDSRGAADGR
ncbi:hypothetical protein [Cognatilysobacter bugurensis]|uniref:Uncharacterized protein n=1 Tax=Cognatilysobacter bugurensis TaxID=543356 RepID=A0A918SWX3_9GAMM|nr:hypothetical protein [Lysobacter bugurensis]GHA76000.1 hypothetical protein GCM10007067_11500 [Lysobacter bugurensis]